MLFRLNTLTLAVVVTTIVVGTTLVGVALGRYLRERGFITVPSTALVAQRASMDLPPSAEAPLSSSP